MPDDNQSDHEVDFNALAEQVRANRIRTARKRREQAQTDDAKQKEKAAAQARELELKRLEAEAEPTGPIYDLANQLHHWATANHVPLQRLNKPHPVRIMPYRPLHWVWRGLFTTGWAALDRVAEITEYEHYDPYGGWNSSSRGWDRDSSDSWSWKISNTRKVKIPVFLGVLSNGQLVTKQEDGTIVRLTQANRRILENYKPTIEEVRETIASIVLDTGIPWR
jgi:hypothetical protein